MSLELLLLQSAGTQTGSRIEPESFAEVRIAGLLDDKLAQLARGEVTVAELAGSLSPEDREIVAPLLFIATMLQSRNLVRALTG